MDNTFIFTGRPGAGKGTQAKMLAEKLDAKFFGAGATLRTFAEQDTFAAKKVKEEMNAGLLVPFGIMVHIFYSIFLDLTRDESVVLDGFARRLIEAQMMTSALEWFNRPFTVINLTIPDEVVQERIRKRRETEDRADDESVENRLKEYEEYTANAIKYFCKHTKVIDIDGTQSIDAIADEIWEKIQ